MTIYALGGVAPEFESRSSNFIADDARIIGKVRVGLNVSIWFGAVLRGDNEWISVGAGSNIQELTVMHTDMGFPLSVGENCTIGHRALLHGCVIGDQSLIGMGAIILNGSVIGKNCLVGAGALVLEGREFPDNSLIAGAPAKLIRSLDEATIIKIREAALHYADNGRRFKTDLKPI